MCIYLSEGDINSTSKPLTPIIETKWLLKDEQLIQLQKEFNGKKYFPLKYRAEVAMRMKLSGELVHRWYEHNKPTCVMPSTKTDADCKYM